MIGMRGNAKFLAGMFAGIALSSIVLLFYFYSHRLWTDREEVSVGNAVQLLRNGNLVDVSLRGSVAGLTTTVGTTVYAPIKSDYEREAFLTTIIDHNNSNPSTPVSLSEEARSAEFRLFQTLLPVMVLGSLSIIGTGLAAILLIRK